MVGKEKEVEEKNDAYATTDDWALDGQVIESREGLSESIQQRDYNLREGEKGGRGEEEGEGDSAHDNQAIAQYQKLDKSSENQRTEKILPIPSSSSQISGSRGMISREMRAVPHSTAVSRSYRSIPIKRGLNVSLKASKSVLKSTRRYSSANHSKDDNSVGETYVSASSRSRVSFVTSARPALTFGREARMGAKTRASIFCICLAISTILAIVVDHNLFGRWFASVFIHKSRLPAEESRLPTPDEFHIFNDTFEIPDLASMNIVIPPKIETLYADWRIPFPALNRSDLPIFWQIPKGGFSVVQRILSQCLNLVDVSEEGAGHDEPKLQISVTKRGTRYINIDPTTMSGLQRAADLKLAESGSADVLFTPLIIEATSIFSAGYHGRFFALFRHPLERAMGIYYGEKSRDPSVKDMSLTEFAGTRLPNNELVRTLSFKSPEEDLTEDDLYLAMEIVRRKCVIGLVSRITESMLRFYETFGWHLMVNGKVNECQAQLLEHTKSAVLSLPQGKALIEIERQNSMDMKLYHYILHLYDLQG
mmetsp:Transcript_22775/g.25091  ORF Transcript_22775/g.25091 Transcript_22775/m.25091 type:complete len:536 (+) Transcript_22775:52-1659(+)